MSAPDPWDGLLDPDEVVVWQGKPSPGVKIEWASPFTPFFFTFFTGFSIFWMVMASYAPGPFWMFGLLFFGVGAYNLVGIHFWKAYLRRNQYYTLTNKRAFIGAQKFGKRSLESHPITAETRLKFEDGDLSSIWFAEKSVRNKNGTTINDIGFEMLPHGRNVFTKFREVQNAQHQHSQE
ncbi:MAG: aspartate carbamoyltransferase catalytic subunit [Sulfitobacter sp.]